VPSGGKLGKATAEAAYPTCSAGVAPVPSAAEMRQLAPPSELTAARSNSARAYSPGEAADTATPLMTYGANPPVLQAPPGSQCSPLTLVQVGVASARHTLKLEWVSTPPPGSPSRGARAVRKGSPSPGGSSGFEARQAPIVPQSTSAWRRQNMRSGVGSSLG